MRHEDIVRRRALAHMVDSKYTKGNLGNQEM